MLLIYFLSYSSIGRGDPGDNLLPQLKIHSTKPLIGYIPISEGAFNFAETDKIAGLPASLLVEGAKSDPAFSEFLQKTGKDPKKISIGDWYKASKSVANLKKGSLMTSGEPITYTKGSTYIDANFSVKAVDTELFSTIEPLTYVAKHHGTNHEYVQLNYDAAKALQKSYALLDSTNRASPMDIQKDFRVVYTSMASFPLLASAVQQKFGDVDFGNPMVFSAKEKKLVVPVSITDKNDVYFIQFAFTFRNIQPSEIEELTFGVHAPVGIEALALIPLRIEKNITESEQLSTPAIKVEAKGLAIELGEFYKQERVFTSLRPRLYAAGLQQNSFSWTLAEDAIQAGSHPFIAILKSPKGKEQVTVQLQVTAEAKGKLWSQGNILSTESDLIEIQLAKKR
jgi:hypothetical protein